MNDLPMPPVAYRMEAERLEVLSFQRREEKRAKRVSVGALACLGVSVILNIALGGAVFEMVPLVRVVPVFAWARPDGTIDTAVSSSSLPASINEAQIRAELWQYVVAREAYSWAEAAYHYNIVSGMSADAVQDAYQKWMNGKQGPAATLGKTGVIRLEFRESKVSGNAFELHYYRVVAIEGMKPVRQPYHVVLMFAQEKSAPAIDRITYNPAGLIVTAYPGPEPDGANPEAAP